MIEPYFAEWKKARDSWLTDKPLDGFREAWKNSNGFEKFAVASFAVYSSILFLVSFFIVFNQEYFPVYCGCYVVFLLLYAIANQVAIARDRRIPERKLEVRAGFMENLRSGFERLGLTNREQVRIVKDEAAWLLDRKEHRYETISRTAIEICIVTALVLALNFVMKLLEYDIPLETAGLLAVIAVVIAVLAVLLILAFWKVCDRFGALPIPKLRLFVSDLNDLLIDELCDPSPSLAVNHRRRLLHRR